MSVARPMRGLTVSLSLLAVFGACKVHETSVAETSITGVWIGTWQLPGQATTTFTLRLESPDEHALGGTCSVERGSQRLDCEVSGTLEADAITLQLTGMSGTFDGTRENPGTLTGALAFNFYSGREEHHAHLEKQKR